MKDEVKIYFDVSIFHSQSLNQGVPGLGLATFSFTADSMVFNLKKDNFSQLAHETNWSKLLQAFSFSIKHRLFWLQLA